MAGDSIIPKQGVGRTFGVAAWILGAVAVLQAGAVGWAIVKRADMGGAGGLLAGVEADAGSGGGEKPLEARGEVGEPPPSPTSAGGVQGGPSTPIEEAAPVVPVSSDLAIIESGTWPRASKDLAIVDPKVIELVDAGALLRTRGDPQGALARLREAEVLSPNHPKILYEIADCFSAMGMRERAVAEWEKILDMGTEQAGDYWMIADVNLRGDSSDEAPSQEALLRVSNILVQRHPEVKEGEKVTVRISVKAKPEEEIVPKEVVVNVFFFDLVNGTDVAQTTADQPRYQWTTLPIDWKDQPEEILNVEYFHPVLSPEQTRDLGERKYHGHIVEVYYRDELQDVIAQPRTLRSLAPYATTPGLQNPLFPAN